MNETIGARLKQSRELHHLTLQQVSESTKIRPHYLQALENDDLSAISSVAQARGFLRIYAEFLGLTPADLVPVTSSTEITPATQPAISSLANSKTNSQEVASVDNPARPGLLTNLLNRIKRPVVNQGVFTQTMDSASSEKDTKASQKEPFVPAHVTEGLPEIPVSVVETPLPEIKAENDQNPVKEGTAKPRTLKKTPSKSRKTSVRLGKEIEVKKKAGG